MTPATGKRSYRACLRCRQRKTRCNLDGIGEPKKSPCVSCYQSGNECILSTKSRRGGNFRQFRGGPETEPAESTYISGQQGGESPEQEESEENGHSSDVLSMDLRNPSDALQILALSGDQPQRRQSTSISNEPADPGMQDSSSAPTSCEPHQSHYKSQTTASIFDDYELVQRGLLRPSVVSELLFKYSRYYHPYCPIAPSHLLRSSCSASIQKSDYFLLTAILTIASRDDPRQSLIHRYCWDHTQRLLVDVLLAHPWTQTPRTVEGLLILAEWLPHIQTQYVAFEGPKNLFSEDRTTWSLIGLAVRQGYLQRLDQGAFPNNDSSQSKERVEQNRLVWAYIFMADRQVSVRLGQSFWSRGPSLAAKFTAQDFPTLQPRQENNHEDYASILQASMELVQILHNAHAILYSSKDRTLAMVYEGNYARYLDDFRISAVTWHSTWSELQVSPGIKSTLFILYQYISLYTNAFSFQAVLTRASHKRNSTTQQQPSKRLTEGVLSNGIMATPDGRYIFDAINAAMNLLTLMNGLDPQQVVCYLPSRYYLYGVYAAVLLHKADRAGAFQSSEQRREVISLASKFVSCLEKAPATELHICHSYSRMLKKLWSTRERKPNQGPEDQPANTNLDMDRRRQSISREPEQSTPSNNFNPSGFFESLAGDDENATFPSIEGYLLGSFMPGVADFSTPGFEEGLAQQYTFAEGFQDWGSYQDGFNLRGYM